MSNPGVVRTRAHARAPRVKRTTRTSVEGTTDVGSHATYNLSTRSGPPGEDFVTVMVPSTISPVPPAYPHRTSSSPTRGPHPSPSCPRTSCLSRSLAPFGSRALSSKSPPPPAFPLLPAALFPSLTEPNLLSATTPAPTSPNLLQPHQVSHPPLPPAEFNSLPPITALPPIHQPTPLWRPIRVKLPESDVPPYPFLS